MNRVVITGMGVVSPLGNEVTVFRDHLLAGTSGVQELTLFDPAGLYSRIAAQCHIQDHHYKDRKIDFSLLASHAAIVDSDRSGEPVLDYYLPTQRGISMGLGLELFDINDMIQLIENDYQRSAATKNRIDFLQTPSHICVGLISKKYDLQIPPAIHISACAAGTDAIGHGFLKIRRGQARMMLVGGTDSMINPLGLGGFCRLKALSTFNQEPQKASRPFDRDRDGFVLGEGAGVMILENYEDAVRRGAAIYAEISGYGNSFDAYGVSEPHPEGHGAILAMRRALKMASILPNQLSYINAHGTSTPKNDCIETIAIKSVCGTDAYRIPISSTKSMIGHLISAGGAVEAIAAIACAHVGYIHPTINLNHPDEDCDLDYVPHTARKYSVGHFMSSSFAFGGQNAVVVFRNWEDTC